MRCWPAPRERSSLYHTINLLLDYTRLFKLCLVLFSNALACCHSGVDGGKVQRDDMFCRQAGDSFGRKPGPADGCSETFKAT